MRRLRLLILFGLAVASPSTAGAAEILPPHSLPGRSTGTRTTWLLGVRPGHALPAGVRNLGGGTIAVSAARARVVAADLRRRGALAYSEPDRTIPRTSSLDSRLDGWARGAVVPSSLTWPTTNVEPIAVLDDFVDPDVPDVAGHVKYLNTTADSVIEDSHGTMVASAAAGALNGAGVSGTLPGAPILSWGLPPQITCSSVVRALNAIRSSGVKIANLSFGGAGLCYAEYLATQRAYGAGMLVVAAAGNDYEDGNPVIYPAAFPHVLSVAAVDQQLRSAPFSSANAAVDVAAPGVGIPLAIPPNFDRDDDAVDGLTVADGTSFAAPIVAGAAAWVRTARPRLSVGQVADVLRFSSRDLGPRGYDDDTGWGLVSVPAALTYRAPADDPGEPNDDMSMVDGSVFRAPDRPVFNGVGTRVIRASADQWEDPEDVYRYRLRPHSRTRITLNSTYGDADLAVFDKTATTVADRQGRVCRSRRGPHRTDGCTIAWNGRHPRIGYVEVHVGGKLLDAGYRLQFTRTG